ncbi:DUF58 domain-containing protein [Luteimonas deserti]|uniref:DUF58 domain-containing protein n=1 Tax=Luteimonas deserti TaxID=2752306 RepID=A0A7Z0QRR5_9GAMM|nr:DUF58 domain-containing protein [Luteimonas deserti]NYZ62776.1 DUF58 domain-containing protein [Luteimonas deserti]
MRAGPSTLEPSGATGVVPSLRELVALREPAGRRIGARQGRTGIRAHAPAPVRGQGMEYAESRDYIAGDDARHIDWRVTARTGRPHTKTFQTERERLTLVVADTAPALYFGTRVRFKSVQAARAGAVAVWAATAAGDRVAALRGTSSEAPVPPAGGRRGSLRVLDALARWYATRPDGDEGLPVAFDHARRLLRPGSRLLVLSDAASALAVPAQRWLALSAHAEVCVVLLTDPLERDPPVAPVRFAAPGGAVALDLDRATVRARWADRFAGGIARCEAVLRASGVRTAVLSTEMASDRWLPIFMRGRTR